MPKLPFLVVTIQTPAGQRDVVTLMPPEYVQKHGMVQEAIVGLLRAPILPDQSNILEVFMPHKLFIDYLHEWITKNAPLEPALREQALKPDVKSVSIIDWRTNPFSGRIPTRDVIGTFAVEKGRIVESSYTRNMKHHILSLDGLVYLGESMQPRMVQELIDRSAKANAPKTGR